MESTPNPQLKIETQIHKGETLGVSITDNGCGIPPNILSQIGAKGLSHGKAHLRDAGSGLGLYHAKTHLERWGGRLDIKSSQAGRDKGTRVSLQLKRETLALETDLGFSV